MVSETVPINLVVLGPPGAGKGTQAIRFAEGHEIPKISTGDILRDAVQSGSDLGRRAETIMNAGGLVDDQLVIAIVQERLTGSDVVRGFVLDGFPRTVAQATALDKIMVGRGELFVVEIEVPDDTLVERVARRRVCDQCGNVTSTAAGVARRCARCGGELVLRSDDTELTVRERLRVYAEETRPLVGHYYSGRPTFRDVDGDQPATVVGAALAEAVRDILATLPAVSAASEGLAG